MAVIAVHLNAGVILVVTSVEHLPPPLRILVHVSTSLETADC